MGVNFLGYHAEAGLGGSGPGLFGGLHASAGTPWGQNAAAGLGGSADGNSHNLLNLSRKHFTSNRRTGQTLRHEKAQNSH